jgi:NAD(P)-dependent dehydrogenase (short-subunit alcohol dehydrogenase family)
LNYLIVGGDSLIGKSIGQQLESEGHQVVYTTRRETSPTKLYFDAQKAGSFQYQGPELAGLVYMPGTINLKPFTRLTEEDFLEDYRINLLGAVKLIQQVLPVLKKQEKASILMFSTVAVQRGLPYHTSISAAKGAVEGFARSLASELAPKIRVNVMAPSLTDTPLAAKLLANDQRRNSGAERHPLKRIGRPQDIATLASFLLTEKSDWITGQVFAVDGGLSSISTG